MKWTNFQLDEKVSNKEAGTLVYFNNLFTVIVRLYKNPEEGKSDIVHLSIKNNDKSTKHDWRSFQRIKNIFFGPDHEAIEIYPSEDELVDGANQYHLWTFLENKKWLKDLHLGFHQGRVVWDGKGEPPTGLNSKNAEVDLGLRLRNESREPSYSTVQLTESSTGRIINEYCECHEPYCNKTHDITLLESSSALVEEKQNVNGGPLRGGSPQHLTSPSTVKKVSLKKE